MAESPNAPEDPAVPEDPQAADPAPRGSDELDTVEEVAASNAWLTEGIGALEPDNVGPGAAAFFDIDNTIMRGSSIVALAKGMADRDYFTTSEVVDFTWKQLKYVLSGRENMDDMAQATENGLLFVKGRKPREIQDMAEQAYDERMVGRLWAGTVELAEAHKALGHEVWLVSATPVEVADVISRRLGLTGGLGTIAEVADGQYTGRLSGVPLHGAAKVEAIQSLAAHRGLDLERCAAYSDSANDIPMLSAVGCPVVINPDGALRAHAKSAGWQIRDYRIRGKESVRKGVPAAAAAGLVAGAAVGVAKGIAVYRSRA
ncbi:MAG TPA: HAD-IB family hydrolase [Motilibacterales bacterium]|nr:HAD-IB family hydrolase [Motilibacterales bacterium]